MKLNKTTVMLIITAILPVWASQGYAQSIDQLHANRSQLIVERQQLTSEITNINAEIAYWRGKIASLQSNCDNELMSLLAEIMNLENEILGCQFLIEAKELEFSEMEKERDAEVAALEEYYLEVDNYLHDEEAINSEFSAWTQEKLDQYYNEEIEKINADYELALNGIIYQIEEIEADISSLQSNMNWYAAQVDGLSAGGNAEAIANAEEALYQEQQNLSDTLQARAGINAQIAAIEAEIIRLGGSF